MVSSKAKTVSIVFHAELDEPSGVSFGKTRTSPGDGAGSREPSNVFSRRQLFAKRCHGGLARRGVGSDRRSAETLRSSARSEHDRKY
jgi:hypothetical protein